MSARSARRRRVPAWRGCATTSPNAPASSHADGPAMSLARAGEAEPPPIKTGGPKPHVPPDPSGLATHRGDPAARYPHRPMNLFQGMTNHEVVSSILGFA